MPLRVFEGACVAVVLLTLSLMARRAPGGVTRLLADYAALAVAGFIGEDTCVRFYRFYAYAPEWDGRVDVVPVLVPLIWPLVILSARSVADALARGASPLRRAIWVGALVVADASLVEVVAVRAGLWSWAEPGHIGVPVLGILGWGFFAFSADLARSLLARAPRALSAIGVVVLAPLATHALLLVAWWSCFRWVLRGDLGWASTAAVVVASILATSAALGARARGRAMPLDVAIPRMVAAALFLAELALTARPWESGVARALWIHTAAVALPYLAATRYRATAASSSPVGPPRATPASR